MAILWTIQRRLPTKFSGISLLREGNEPVECVALLKALNETIETMYCLSDTSYYLDYIWNAGTWVKERLKENDLDEDYFIKVAEKLETLRAILMGDSLDYNKLYEDMYHELLGHEAYWNKWHEEMLDKVSRERDKLQREAGK